MGSETQIVIRAQQHHLVAIETDARALRGLDDPSSAVERIPVKLLSVAEMSVIVGSLRPRRRLP
jgi:hypothetical protein